MKNITKTIAVLVSSSLISFAAVAGDVNLSGSVKASYSISGGANDSSGKGLGVSNELKASASGELDNGFTWSYHTELDPADSTGTTVNDDSQIVIGMGDLGTIGFFDGEGSLHSNLKWGIGAMGTGNDYAGTVNLQHGADIDAEANVQYHSPAGLLPFALQVKVGYAPNLADGATNDYKSGGAEQTITNAGKNATQYNITATPIEGLNIGADYYETGDTLAANQHLESGAAFAQYAIGNFKLGYGMALHAPIMAAGTKDGVVSGYEVDSLGIEFAVNDALTISWSEEKSERSTYNNIAAGATSNTKTKVETEVTSVQAAYVIGGATVGLAITEADNADFTTGKEEKKTMFSLAMAIS
jgi:hypothetical protein